MQSNLESFIWSVFKLDVQGQHYKCCMGAIFDNTFYRTTSEIRKILFPMMVLETANCNLTKRWFKTSAQYCSQKAVRDAVERNLSPRLLFKIVDTQIQPILDYGCEVWYMGKTIDEIETVSLPYMKSSLGVKIQTSTRAVYGETGRFPLLLRQQVMLLKYCQRLISLPCDHVLKIVYGQLMKADGNGFTKWCKYVKELLLNFSMTNLWENQQNMGLNILRNFANNFKTENESRFKRV